MFYYDIIYKYLLIFFPDEITNLILLYMYPKKYFYLNIIKKEEIINYSTNIKQNIIYYNNLGQQNCNICGHLEIIVLDKKKTHFKTIILDSKYKCKCKCNNKLYI